MSPTVAVRIAQARSSAGVKGTPGPAAGRPSPYRGTAHSRRRSLPISHDFLACVSHDLRSPLTSVREFVALVHEGIFGPINEKQERALAIALRNADTIAEMIEHVLTASRIHHGAFRLHCRRVRLSELLDERVLAPAGRRQTKDVNLRIRVSPAAPDVYADPDRLLEAIRNLIDNSIRYSGDRVSVELEISAGEGGMVHLSVRDDGWGMDDETVRTIFNRFQRGERMSRVVPGGLGLGLSIVKEIVVLHGGTIRVRSMPGAGTEFLLSLPSYEPRTILETFLRGMWTIRSAESGGFAHVQIRVGELRGCGAKRREEVMEIVAEVLEGVLGKREQMMSPLEEDGAFSLLLAVTKGRIARRLRRIQDETTERLRFHHGILLEWSKGTTAMHSTSYDSPESMAAAILVADSI